MSLFTHIKVLEILFVLLVFAWMVLDTNVKIQDVLGDESPFRIKDMKLRHILLVGSPFVQIISRFLATLLIALGILDYFTPEVFFSSTRRYVISVALLILIGVICWNVRQRLRLVLNAALSVMFRQMTLLQAALHRVRVLILDKLARVANNVQMVVMLIVHLFLVSRLLARSNAMAILVFAIMLVSSLSPVREIAVSDDQYIPTDGPDQIKAASVEQGMQGGLLPRAEPIRVKAIAVNKPVEGNLESEAKPLPITLEPVARSQHQFQFATAAVAAATPLPEWKPVSSYPTPVWPKVGTPNQSTPQSAVAKSKPAQRKPTLRPQPAAVELPEEIAAMPDYWLTIDRYGPPTSVSLNSDGHAFLYYDHMTAESYRLGEGFTPPGTETMNFKLTNCHARFEFYLVSVGDRLLPIKNSQSNCTADFRRAS